MARRSTDVCTTSGSRPDSRISSPPRRASASPLALRSTSTQPVNRFLAFHSLSPCRKSTSVPTSLMPPSSRTESLRQHRTSDVRCGRVPLLTQQAAGPVLDRVDRDAGQPRGRLRRHLPDDLPDHGAGLQRVCGRAGPRALRARRCDRRHRRRSPDRPVGAATDGAAGDGLRLGADGGPGIRAQPPGDHGRRAGAGHGRGGRPPAARRDDRRPGAGRRPRPGLLRVLLGGQPRLRDRGDPGRLRRRQRLPDAVPRRRRDDRRRGAPHRGEDPRDQAGTDRTTPGAALRPGHTRPGPRVFSGSSSATC